MLRFILRRVAILLPTVFGVTIVAFLFVHALPGDPVLLLAGERGLTPDRYQEALHRARVRAGDGRPSSTRPVPGLMWTDTLQPARPGAFQSPLPPLTLRTRAHAASPVAGIARQPHPPLLGVLGEDYVRTARAKV